MAEKEKGAATTANTPIFKFDAKITKKVDLQKFATKNFGLTFGEFLEKLDAVAMQNNSNVLVFSKENDQDQESQTIKDNGESKELEAIKDGIMSDVAKLEAYAKQAGEKKYGSLIAYDCNEYAMIAAQEPDAKPLYKELWFEGQIAIFFARDGTGKSILAMQIAAAIAEQRNVVYFDFEMSLSDFRDRYIAKDGTPYSFPNRLKYIAPDYYNSSKTDILDDIENCAKGLQSDVLIIDNITALSCELEEGSEAIKLMQRIKRMAHANRWSIMLVAHTPKLMDGCPIRQTDVAGSKKLTDLAASVFSIGKSIKNEPLRYLIQFKQRHSHTEFYDQNNVLLLRLNKIYNFLCFSEVETSTEVEELCLSNPKGGRQPKQCKLEECLGGILADGKVMGKNELARALVEKLKDTEEAMSLSTAKRKITEKVGVFLAVDEAKKYGLMVHGSK